MKVVCVSDLHGHLPEISDCDLVLIGGDLCPLGSEPGYGGSVEAQQDWLEGAFDNWLISLPATHIVGVAGNHDFIAEGRRGLMQSLSWTYLEDEAIEVEGLKIWGSPYSNFLPGWVFMETDDKLAKRWEKIPDDTDILLTHGPAEGLLDKTLNGDHPGSISLRQRLRELQSLRLFVCGHIHEAYGIDGLFQVVEHIPVVNASHVTFPGYNPVNPPIVVEL